MKYYFGQRLFAAKETEAVLRKTEFHFSESAKFLGLHPDFTT